MSWDGIYRLTSPPMTGEQVKDIQRKAGGGAYAHSLGLVVNGVYDAPTAQFVKEFQAYKTRTGTALPKNKAAAPGECDYATKVALGVVASAAVVPNPPGAVAYTVAGTWAGWNDGPPAWTAWRLDHSRFWQQGVDYPAMGFLTPDPNVSYNESRDAGIAEMLRLALPDPRPKVPIGYSQGADVVNRFLYAWPAERRDEIRCVIKFGDPGHLPGVQGSVHGGISGLFTPDWAADRTMSYQLPGDMYGDAPGLLPFLYDVLTRMDMSIDFMGFMFTLLTGIPLSLGGVLGGLGSLGGLLGGLGGLGGPAAVPNQQGAPSVLGGQLLGLPGVAGKGLPGFGSISGILGLVTPGPVTQTGGPISLAAMLLNIPAIVQTLIAALKFVFTGAHMKYGGDGSIPAFDGVDAVIHAAGVINRLTI
jgi:hypothetical protein